jgi:hypothetical protein
MRITEAALVPFLFAALMVGCSSNAAFAQADAWGVTQPAWGQWGTPPAWGQYGNRIGATGWQLNQTQQPVNPTGPETGQNALDAAARTQSLFTHPDTRLLGRNAP